MKSTVVLSLAGTALCLLIASCPLPAVAAPSHHRTSPRFPTNPGFPVASRIPLRLRHALYIRFMDAIQKADDEAEKKYPTPLGYVPDHARYDRYMATRTIYAGKLTERYTSRIRRSYGVSSREEDLIESQGAQKEWPN